VIYETLIHRIINNYPFEQCFDADQKCNLLDKVKYKGFGVEKTISEWLKDSRCPYKDRYLFSEKLRASGDVETVFANYKKPRSTTRKNEIKYKAFGVYKTAKQWVEDPRCNLSLRGLRSRLQNSAYAFVPNQIKITTDEAAYRLYCKKHRPKPKEKHEMYVYYDYECIPIAGQSDFTIPISSEW